MVDNGTLEKIRQLLAMAEHPNSNEHEAAIALERAQDLLLRNNLSRADIATGNGEPATPVGIGVIDGTETTGYTWKAGLLHVIAKASLCKVIGTPSKNQWHIFGTYDNVRGVLEMYHWIIPQLETMALEGWKRYQADGSGYEHCRTWKTGFFFGATTVIRDRLQASMDTFAANAGRALVPYNQALVDTAVAKVYPSLRRGGYRSIRSADGVSAGRSAGNNIRLKPQRKLAGTFALNSGR